MSSHPTTTTFPPITSLQGQHHYRDNSGTLLVHLILSNSFHSLCSIMVVSPLAAIHPATHVPPFDLLHFSIPSATNSAWGQRPPTPPPDCVPSEEHITSWFSDLHPQSSQYTAENTCDVICYLWFSQSSKLSPVTHLPHNLSYLSIPSIATHVPGTLVIHSGKQ